MTVEGDDFAESMMDQAPVHVLEQGDLGHLREVGGQVGQPLNEDNAAINAWYNRVKERPSTAA